MASRTSRQPVIEPSRARRRNLIGELKVRARSQHQRRPRVLRAAEAAHLDESTRRRGVREGLDASEPDMVSAAIRAVDHRIGLAGQLVVEPLIDQPADDRRARSLSLNHVIRYPPILPARIEGAGAWS